MRNRFDSQLEQLNAEIVGMGALCESAIAGAVKALLTQDVVLAKNVACSDDVIDRKEKTIQDMCLKLLLEQQPVARDLRIISSALKMITDMERIGDQAADISEIVMYATFSGTFGGGRLTEMARAVIGMVNDSIDAFVATDLKLAHRVISDDDNVDSLFERVKGEIITRISGKKENEDTEKICGEAIDMLMIAKYLERIGDHATNIAEWVCFSVTGSREND